MCVLRTRSVEFHKELNFNDKSKNHMITQTIDFVAHCCLYSFEHESRTELPLA